MAVKQKLTEEEQKEHLQSISFSNLVKAIDEKWSHTYIDVSHLSDHEEVDEEATLQEQ
jgi:hypothetical protein